MLQLHCWPWRNDILNTSDTTVLTLLVLICMVAVAVIPMPDQDTVDTFHILIAYFSLGFCFVLLGLFCFGIFVVRAAQHAKRDSEGAGAVVDKRLGRLAEYWVRSGGEQQFTGHSPRVSSIKINGAM